MARKTIAPVSTALGLRRMKRPSGRIDCYWVADPKLVHAGYPLRTQRLTGDPNKQADWERMERTCRRLQAEMMAWGRGERSVGGRSPRGSLAWLCEAFEVDRDSPMRGLRHSTQLGYARYLRMLVETVGATRLTTISGKTVRGWHERWLIHGERTARYCVQMLRRVVKYGVECATRPDDPCMFLVSVLSNMRFPIPKGRDKRVTHEIVAAFRPAAIAAGRSSIALAVTLQFDLGLRQKDVIGEWVPMPAKPGQASRCPVWRWGLAWTHIDADGILRKPTSKSNGKQIAEHDLKSYPETLALLQAVPAEKRVGPVVVDERSGQPYRVRQFKVQFRRIANASGWPKDVWNMDCRAGAISEAFEAGADHADVMKAATHTQMSTTMGYNRGGVVQSSRVAELRMARRRTEPAPEV